MPNRADRRHDQVKTRDEDMRLGGLPRPATEPNEAEGWARNTKTQTDPATEVPRPGTPKPC